MLSGSCPETNTAANSACESGRREGWKPRVRTYSAACEAASSPVWQTPDCIFPQLIEAPFVNAARISAVRHFAARLPGPRGCANLEICAVLRAERECVRARFLPPLCGLLVGSAGVAQLVEHLICNQRVGGSNPFASSTSGLHRRGGKDGRKFDRRRRFPRRASPPRRSH